MSERHRLYIDGAWCDGTTGERVGVINPATEEVIEETPFGGVEDVRRALAAASRAFPAWRDATAYERGAVLKRTADLLRERAPAVARLMTMETGKAIGEAQAEVMAAAGYFEWYAEEGKRAYGRIVPAAKAGVRRWVLRQPVGVCAAICAWNFPVVLPTRKTAAALAAGCTMVARPASQAPLAAMEMIACLHDAGCPPGVVNHVTGPAAACAEELTGNPQCRKLSFTGSTEVGRELLRLSAPQIKKLSLELGGSAPVLVFPDVDVEAVARLNVTGKFRNMGQVCIAATRFYVHESIFEAYVAAAAQAATALRLGDGLDPATNCGPLFNAEARERVEGFLADAVAQGATVVCGGRRPPDQPRGYFYEPTVLTGVSAAARLTCEEVFGPLMPIMPFSSTQEAISLANATPYGLAGYLFTRNLSTAVQVAEALEFGLIGLNDMVPATPETPFGGMKESGLGREGGSEGLDVYLETKYVSVGLEPL